MTERSSVVMAAVCLLLGALTAFPAHTQAPATPPPLTPRTLAPGEAEALQKMAADLNRFAAESLRAGYPSRARSVLFEILEHYDTDDATAREALGYRRAGTVWQPRADFEFPRDDDPDPDVARILTRRWEKLVEDLAERHRRLAESLREEGHEASAAYHFERALRFDPEDDDAKDALGRASVEGVSGSALELTLLNRSRLIDRTVETVLDMKMRTREVRKVDNRYVAQAGIELRGVSSEHFVVLGTYGEDVLEEAAAVAERAWTLCRALYADHDDYFWSRLPSPPPMTMVFFEDRADWEAFLRANASAFSGDQLEFVLQNTAATNLGGGPDELKVAAPQGEPVVYDLAARWTAQRWGGFRTDAMREGIGHAVVGALFGRNLVFSVAQKKDDPRRTSARSERRIYQLKLPDLEVWEQLAVEFAQEKTDMPAAELPLLTAASFPDEGRIKAWALNDYLLRRDPALAKVLDKGTGNKGRVAAEFYEAAGISLAEVDRDWRRFWTEESEVMRAIHGERTPLDNASKAAGEWLAALDRARKQVWANTNDDGRPIEIRPLGWNASASTACRQHAAYLAANRRARDADSLHTQDPTAKEGSTAGRGFAATAVVSVGESDPEKAIERWLAWPGYRDVLLNRSLGSVGLFAESRIAVFEVVRGVVPGPQGVPSAQYPRDGQRAVPTEVDVEPLGALVADALKERRIRARKIGFPISFHFFRAGALPRAATLTLTHDDESLEGFVVRGLQGNRRASAPGMVVFYPLEPLPRGAQLEYVWEFVDGRGEKQTVRGTFVTS